MKSLTLPERIDSFNQEQILSDVRSGLKVEKSGPLTLDMTATRFVSLPFIKKLAEIAIDLRAKEKQLTLLNASEKVKKQIAIFSDIELFEIKRAVSKREWPELDGSAGS